MAERGLGGGIHEILARDAHAVPRELGKARAAPKVGFHTPVVLQEIGGGDDFAEDRAGPQQLDTGRLRFPVTGVEQVHALDDAGRSTFGHRRVCVVLVHHRQVVIAVLLLGIHPPESVLHDDGNLVAERRVVRNAIRDRRRDHVRVTVLVLQSLAVQCCAARSAA